ncbi:MAG: sodium:solute symporter [Chitinophagaceae bacterium]|nr:sodium:solute symporter [Chitinophagaceae bacterium]
MTPLILFSFVIAYFAILLVVAWYTSRNANNDSFFIGNRNSNWMLVAFGMVGTSLSGVTFVSVPGTVGAGGFAYFQVVIGYVIGYFIVAYVLLPLYYRLNLTSIYNYLQRRFGYTSYKTGALFFIISRTIGATARLYLVINVLQIFILNKMGVPFAVTTAVILLMILLYTFEGGVKTIVFTDTLQTTFMLLGLVICIVYIMNGMHLSFSDTIQSLNAKGYTRIFNEDVKSGGFWMKQILGGAFITIAMTGLDQEMMQKNISVKTLKGSQKNMITLSFLQAIVVFMFLVMGGLLYLYATSKGITTKGDDLFPTIALNYLPTAVSIIFIIGLISALFPSADGAITALTSSFCIDILGIKRNAELTEAKRKKTRRTVHLVFTFIFFVCVMIFKVINNKSIIGIILDVAGYTYGPLLGLFAFGIISRRTVRNHSLVPVICILSPILCYILKTNSAQWFNGYQIGIELLILNGLLTYLGLLAVSSSQRYDAAANEIADSEHPR